MTEPVAAKTSAAAPAAGPWVLAAGILASAMAFIDATALNVALPTMQADLGATGAQLLWVVNGYLLTQAALMLVGGALGDRLGRRRVFMAGIALFVAASVISGLAPTVQFLIAARLVQGIGAAIMVPGSLSLISAVYPRGQRGRAIGTWSSVTTLVTVGGPVLGGFLANAGLWRGVFLINLPLGVVALIILYLRAPESRDETTVGPIDIPGAVLATLGLGGLTYGFLTLPDLGFEHPLVAVPLAGGATALIVFLFVERRSDHPMMPLHLFASRSFTGANVMTLFLFAALFSFSFFLSINLVQAQGYDPSQAGLAFIPFALMMSVLSRWAGGLVDRIGPRPPLILGPALTGAGFFWLSTLGLTGGPADYWTTFFPAIVTMGLGMALTVAPLTTTVMTSVATHYAGTASGINNAISRAAGVLSLAILGALALIIFGGALADRSTAIDLTTAARQALQAEAARLGDATVPDVVSAANAAAVDQAIRLALTDTYRRLMQVAAALTWLSGLAAALLIERRLTDHG